MGLSLLSAQPAACDCSHRELDGSSQDLKVTPSMVAIPSACSESKAQLCHCLKQQPEEAARTKGLGREAEVLLALLSAQLT